MDGVMNSREPVTNVDIPIFERYLIIFIQKLISISFMVMDVTVVTLDRVRGSGRRVVELGQR